jgi:flagellin
MSMVINSNLNSLAVQSKLGRSQDDLASTIQRLSSGLRISTAKDDAAGLAISERMTTKVRGLSQAARNLNDGISMLQVAEGGLSSIAANLQRARELSVQAANGTLSTADKQSLQQEVSQLIAEVNRVATTTQFNGLNIYNSSTASVVGDPNQVAVLQGLQNGWLENAEKMVTNAYGLTADNVAMSIELTTFTDGAGGTAARVVSSVPASGPGKGANIRLQVDMADFTPPNLPDGGNAPFYNDRIIAHEMVHAVMARTMNWAELQDDEWFLEGTAEFIHGADERVAADLAAAGGGAGGAAALVTAVTNGWDPTSADYSGSYAAVRYLHSQIKAAGGAGIKDMMTYLSANPNADLDDAFANAVATKGGVVAGYTSASAFLTDFGTNGAAFILGMNLANTDTGAIGGLDADGGAIKTATSVVPNGGTLTGTNVLAGFSEEFEAIATANGPRTQLAMQAGAEKNQTLDVTVGAANATALGIANTDIVSNAAGAILSLDRALEYVSAERTKLGAQMNRMEASIANLSVTKENLTASRGRITDADFAMETAALARQQVLQQAAVAMLAQTNVSGREVLQLLR